MLWMWATHQLPVSDLKHVIHFPGSQSSHQDESILRPNSLHVVAELHSPFSLKADFSVKIAQD